MVLSFTPVGGKDTNSISRKNKRKTRGYPGMHSRFPEYGCPGFSCLQTNFKARCHPRKWRRIAHLEADRTSRKWRRIARN
eukprot:1499299-Rhodomonas_salina.1